MESGVSLILPILAKKPRGIFPRVYNHRSPVRPPLPSHVHCLCQCQSLAERTQASLPRYRPVYSWLIAVRGSTVVETVLTPIAHPLTIIREPPSSPVRTSALSSSTPNGRTQLIKLPSCASTACSVSRVSSIASPVFRGVRVNR
jgi:hypothetical protein